MTNRQTQAVAELKECIDILDDGAGSAIAERAYAILDEMKYPAQYVPALVMALKEAILTMEGLGADSDTTGYFSVRRTLASLPDDFRKSDTKPEDER